MQNSPLHSSMGRRRIRVTLTLSTREFLVRSVEVDKQLNDLFMLYYLAEAYPSSQKYWVVNKWRPRTLLSVLWYDTQASIYSRERLYDKTLDVDGLRVLMENQHRSLPVPPAVDNKC